MFITHIIHNFRELLTLWLILTVMNQVIFFGACLKPYCVLASIPHVSIITLILYYYSFNFQNTTYDEKTGYNRFGYDKYGYSSKAYNREGYDKNGYNLNGYDKYGYGRDGYNINGLDRNSLDRNFHDFISRFFTSVETKKELKRLNDLAIQKNKSLQDSFHKKLTASKENTEFGTIKATKRNLQALASYKAKVAAILAETAK